MSQEPKLAFEDIDGYELYPCVIFYSSNPGEKVSFVSVQLCFSVCQFDTRPFCSHKQPVTGCLPLFPKPFKLKLRRLAGLSESNGSLQLVLQLMSPAGCQVNRRSAEAHVTLESLWQYLF